MFISFGDIDSVMKWIEKNHWFDWLCLLVAGHLNDEKLFGNIFDKKESIDLVSGERIAVFLFSNEKDLFTEFGYAEGHYAILPGRLIGCKYQDWRYRHVSEISASDLRNYNLRESVIKTSQTVSMALYKKFNLDSDDIPCILLLAQGEFSPFIIRTKGEAEIEHFFDFLKDIRKLTNKLPNFFNLDLSLKAAGELVKIEKESKQKAWVTEAENELQSKIKQIHEILIEFGMPRVACNKLFNAQVAAKVWEFIGLVPNVTMHPLAIKYSKIIDRAIAEANLKPHIREMTKAAKKLKRAVLNRNTHVKTLKTLFPKLHTVRDSIKQICQRYERKFYWKAKYRPLKQFIETFSGKSKKVSDLLSLEKDIWKILNR